MSIDPEIKRILDKRLASGEISKKEYRELTSEVTSLPAKDDQLSDSRNVPAAKTTWKWKAGTLFYSLFFLSNARGAHVSWNNENIESWEYVILVYGSLICCAMSGWLIYDRITTAYGSPHLQHAPTRGAIKEKARKIITFIIFFIVALGLLAMVVLALMAPTWVKKYQNQLNQIESLSPPIMFDTGEATQSDSSYKEPVDIDAEIDSLERVREVIYHKYRAGEYTRNQYEIMKSINDRELHKLKAKKDLLGY